MQGITSMRCLGMVFLLESEGKLSVCLCVCVRAIFSGNYFNNNYCNHSYIKLKPQKATHLFFRQYRSEVYPIHVT